MNQNEMEMDDKRNGIDLVYLWVDGNDPVWRAKRNAFMGKAQDDSPENCKGRTADNDELKYSLRSVEAYAPWIRNVFIVTDGQVPGWLDTSNPRVRVVDLTEIMPPHCLPCFNSSLIEKFLYRIPGLAEQFLYANDDMFINRPVTAADFFTPEGFPLVRLTRKPFRKLRWFWRERIRRKPLKNYSATIALASRLVEGKYGIYYTGMPHHNIDSYLKSDCRRVAEEVLRDEFLSNHKNHTRSGDDIQRIVFSYIALAEKRGRLRYVTDKESMHVGIHKKRHYERLERNRPMFFCMNDSEYATDEDRSRSKAYLEKRFPGKSSFEK